MLVVVGRTKHASKTVSEMLSLHQESEKEQLAHVTLTAQMCLVSLQPRTRSLDVFWEVLGRGSWSLSLQGSCCFVCFGSSRQMPAATNQSRGHDGHRCRSSGGSWGGPVSVKRRARFLPGSQSLSRMLWAGIFTPCPLFWWSAFACTRTDGIWKLPPTHSIRDL